MVAIADIQELRTEQHGPYKTIIHIPTLADPENGFGMSSETDANRVVDALRTFMQRSATSPIEDMPEPPLAETTPASETSQSESIVAEA
jgi:hypothetical protein